MTKGMNKRAFNRAVKEHKKRAEKRARAEAKEKAPHIFDDIKLKIWKFGLSFQRWYIATRNEINYRRVYLMGKWTPIVIRRG